MSPNCPRCGSCNTKFCYYNNYSLTQPRYFCKGCRRYWTKGGSLRNVPVGGGCRKSRRGKSLRVLNDHNIPSRNSLNYGDDLQSPSSSMVPSIVTNNIDIAQVYANFLKQKPESRPESPSNMDPSLQFTSVSNIHMDFDCNFRSGIGILEGASLSHRPSGDHLNGGGGIYFSGFDKQQETIHPFSSDRVVNDNNGLPPLPGEEVVPLEMGWQNTVMMAPSSILHVPQLSGIQPEAQYADQLIGNEGSFDTSSYGTLFRP